MGNLLPLGGQPTRRGQGIDNLSRPLLWCLVSLCLISRGTPSPGSFLWGCFPLPSCFHIHLVTSETKLLCVQWIPVFFYFILSRRKKPLSFSANIYKAALLNLGKKDNMNSSESSTEVEFKAWNFREILAKMILLVNSLNYPENRKAEKHFTINFIMLTLSTSAKN